MRKVMHYAKYVEYTGWYALCRVDSPELDMIPWQGTKDRKKVTCPQCKEKIEELPEGPWK